MTTPASTLHVCGIATSVVREEREPERWCFGERKRRAGTSLCHAPSFEELERTGAWGWAEPYWTYRCDGCGQDRRLFPGSGW
jgi:hypothetical protein